MNNKFIKEIERIALKTFEITTYMFPLDDMEIEEMNTEETLLESISASVSFEGAARGEMIISASPGLYEAIVENMLGVDDTTTEEKDAALCEIANIICGNIVPLFANNGLICKINPPAIVQNGEASKEKFKNFLNEDVTLFLDEGIAKISIFYTQEVADHD